MPKIKIGSEIMEKVSIKEFNILKEKVAQLEQLEKDRSKDFIETINSLVNQKREIHIEPVMTNDNFKLV